MAKRYYRPIIAYNNCAYFIRNGIGDDDWIIYNNFDDILRHLERIRGKYCLTWHALHFGLNDAEAIIIDLLVSRISALDKMRDR